MGIPKNSGRVFSRRQLLCASAATAGSMTCGRLLGQSVAALEPARAIGVNLAPVRYWSTERPFNNLFLSSSPHVSLKRGGRWNDGGPLDVDENGWIRRFQPGQSAAFLIDMKRSHSNTVYEVLYRGGHNAIRIQGGNGNLFMKKSPDTRLLVRMHAPIRDVIVRERGFRPTGTFAQRFLDRCRGYHTLRFMDWQGTNENREINWESRVTDKFYTQAGIEVALEYRVELCNETSSAMWYCAHHRASDDYLRQAARYLKSNLTNGRPIYLEHSNEVWNGQFSQHHYCKTQNDDWMQYHMRRTAEAAQIFRAEGLEIVSVLGLHSASTWHSAKALANGVPDGIDATAIAPYFGGRVCRRPEIVKGILEEGVDRVLTECEKEIEERRSEVARHREIAGAAGLQLLGYEGGQHLVALGPQRKNQKLVRILIAANRHPKMYDLYSHYLSMWNDETDNGLICLYYSAGEPNKSGCWGLLEYDGQPLERAPKFRAVVDAMQHAPVLPEIDT